MLVNTFFETAADVLLTSGENWRILHESVNNNNLFACCFHQNIIQRLLWKVYFYFSPSSSFLQLWLNLPSEDLDLFFILLFNFWWSFWHWIGGLADTLELLQSTIQQNTALKVQLMLVHIQNVDNICIWHEVERYEVMVKYKYQHNCTVLEKMYLLKCH